MRFPPGLLQHCPEGAWLAQGAQRGHGTWARGQGFRTYDKEAQEVLGDRKDFRNIPECFPCTRLCAGRVTCVTLMTDHPISKVQKPRLSWHFT